MTVFLSSSSSVDRVFLTMAGGLTFFHDLQSLKLPGFSDYFEMKYNLYFLCCPLEQKFSAVVVLA